MNDFAPGLSDSKPETANAEVIEARRAEPEDVD